MATKYYAWSEIRNGGEVEEITRPGGAKKAVVTKRNVIRHGDEIKKSDIPADDWDRLVQNGVIRDYPLPKGADDTVSPHQAVLKELYKDGEIDVDKLIQFQMVTGGVASEPEEEAETPKGA